MSKNEKNKSAKLFNVAKEHKPKINVRRPELELDLPAPKKHPESITERTHRKDIGEAKLLMSVGQRICPDGMQYMGSGAFHIYRPKLYQLSTDVIVITQSANIGVCPERAVVHATQELTKKMMKLFGHNPPKKRSDIVDKHE